MTAPRILSRQRFNSRSRVGSDEAWVIQANADSRFNSRSRVGSDWQRLGGLKHCQVSIRAPAWGATGDCKSGRAPIWFQFALPRGERRDIIRLAVADWLFQFALPRGERHNKVNYEFLALMFQFALPRGERPRGRVPCWFTGWFQFALPRGERLQPVWRISTIRKFQFALPRGERRILVVVVMVVGKFQFALPRGERLAQPTISSQFLCFNSRSRVGSDMVCASSIQARSVSIRAPAWGAT